MERVSALNYEFPLALLVQFAKAPLLGQVKTRMQPVLSVAQSLALHCDLVRHTHQTLHRDALCQSQLWTSGEDRADFFKSLLPPPDIQCQQGVDLGERMHFAIASGLKRWRAVVLIGSDCPAINGNYLRQALLALESVDVVLGPAADGGYVLIAMKRAEPRVFEGVEWSTCRVLGQTQARLASLKMSCHVLPVLNDIDRPEDLVHLNGLAPQQNSL
ncbi:hypothetical protein A9Q90_01520 [Gammaproteobacteria bacterium 54_18_T64]|nr:hypothetical protein A9Q90_01520 [Gammaproteobacteria bacterium 54_18_T64]